jgi:hypothetical protein
MNIQALESAITSHRSFENSQSGISTAALCGCQEALALLAFVARFETGLFALQSGLRVRP